MRVRRKLRAAALAATYGAALIAAPTPARADEELTTCGQSVSGSVYLTADLDCTGAGGPIISGYELVRLDLRGHTLTTDCVTVVQGYGNADVHVISSEGTGRLQGPGNCTNFYNDAVINLYRRVMVRDVVIDGYAQGVLSGATTVIRSTISNNTGAGIRASGPVTLKDSVIENNGGGGAGGQRLGARRSAIRGNGGDGVLTSRAKLSECEIADNGGHGVYATWSLKLIETEVHGNGLSGFHNEDILEPRPALLKDSNVTGNGVDPSCTPSTCADVISNISPLFRGASTCGTSLDPYTQLNLGVCTLD